MEKIKLPEFHAIGITVESNWEGLHREMPLKWEHFKKKVARDRKQKNGCNDGY